MPAARKSSTVESSQQTVQINIGPIELNAEFLVAPDPRATIVFAHGSGSSRLSPRNRQAANKFRRQGYSSLLVDLLTPEEESMDLITGGMRFDIDRLTSRLVQCTEWLFRQPEFSGLPVGYFGASTGAAAVLAASVEISDIGAVVSRGGRPDLAGSALDSVRAPVLLIVGGNDPAVLELNRQAFLRLPSEKSLKVVEGAGHLFEEPGALDRVARLASDWFLRYLG